jgi:hypothetical protein
MQADTLWFLSVTPRGTMSKFGTFSGLIAATGCLALACGALSPASALDSCSGQYSAALLHPLPLPTVTALDIHDNSPTNVALGQSFMIGLRAAGQATEGAPSAKISVNYQIMGQGNGGPGYSGGGLGQGGGAGSQSDWSGWSNGSTDSMRGGQTMALPEFPRYDAFKPRQAAQSALLILRVEVHDAQTNALDWVASMQCTMQGTDDQQLAYQLGYLIGGVMGKRIDRQAM